MAAKTTSSKRQITTQKAVGDGPETVVADEKPPFHPHQGIQLLLIVLIGILAYSNTFHSPFVFDDASSIVSNPVIRNLSNFSSNLTGYEYNPRRFVGYLSLALNYSLGGLSVTGYHVFNVTVHVCTALLAYRFTLLTCSTPHLSTSAPRHGEKLAFCVALLFISHPIQTQAVTYIIQRLASLATLFYLLSMVFYVQARFLQQARAPERGRAHATRAGIFLHYFLAVVSALLAMKTKEIAFTLPVTVVLYELFFFPMKARKKGVILAAILGVLALVPLGMSYTGVPISQFVSDFAEQARETTEISRGDYLLTQFSVVTTYLRLLLLPIDQNLDYDYPVYHSLFAPRVFFSFLLLAGLAALSAFLFLISRRDAKRELRLASFGIAWFFLTLSIESSLIPINDVIFEHRLYLPSFGIFLALAAGVACLPMISARSYHALAVACALVLAGATWSRNLVWQSPVALWSDAVAKSPLRARAHYNLGKSLAEAGRTDEAIDHLQTALRMKHIYDQAKAQAHAMLGTAYVQKGMHDVAIGHLTTALRMKLDDAKIHYDLGVAYGKTGLVDESIRSYLLAAARDPGHADTRYNLALAYAGREKLADAIREFEAALRITPNDCEVHNSLGIVRVRTGQLRRAVGSFQKASSLDPQNEEYRENWARASQIYAEDR